MFLFKINQAVLTPVHRKDRGNRIKRGETQTVMGFVKVSTNLKQSSGAKRKSQRVLPQPKWPGPYTSAIFSHGLGFTWEECGLARKAKMVPEEVNTRTASSFLHGNPGTHIHGGHPGTGGQVRKKKNQKVFSG